MFAFFAFLLLLTVFSLAAQCVGYLAYTNEKALKGSSTAEVPWPTLPDSPAPPEDFPFQISRHLVEEEKNTSEKFPKKAKLTPPDTFPLDSKRALAVNVPYTPAILQSTQGEELLP